MVKRYHGKLDLRFQDRNFNFELLFDFKLPLIIINQLPLEVKLLLEVELLI